MDRELTIDQSTSYNGYIVAHVFGEATTPQKGNLSKLVQLCEYLSRYAEILLDTPLTVTQRDTA